MGWMIALENGVKTIVMLNQEAEEARIQYWPTEIGLATKYSDDFAVTLLDQKIINDNIIMRSIKVFKGNQTATKIKHYQYINWTERGTPDKTRDVIELVRLMNASILRDGGIPLVHCGNGADRTGTFLAIVNSIKALQNDSQMDVVKTVKDLRDLRPSMVGNEVQYRFIYEVLRDYVATFDVYDSI